jgi:hypothetical protein
MTVSVSVTFDKPLASLKVGDVAQATISANGVPITSGNVLWAYSHPGIVLCKPLPSMPTPGTVASLTAVAVGTTGLYCILRAPDGTPSLSALMNVVVASAAPLPPPPPPPIPLPTAAPALGWKRLRDHILLVSTDFYYSWDKWVAGTIASPMETLYAKRYDVTYSGDPLRHARLRAVNPNIKTLPYTLEITTLQPRGADLPSLSSTYENDFIAWCATNKITAAAQEHAWLHLTTGIDRASRVQLTIWNSPRFLGDPTDQTWRRYTIDRYVRLAAQSYADGLFADEFGSNPMRSNYKLSTPLDPARLQAICDAETTLIAEIAAAIYPKQFVINTASYNFAWDADLTKAARGTHLEQVNNPMPIELATMWWPYIDKLLAAQVFVNLVPPYQFGEYEHGSASRDQQVPPNQMDTPRGKLCELVSYYMIVTDPALLGLSIENSWSALPVQDYLPQIDAPIGRALEPRQTGRVDSHNYYTRRFSNGLVMFNPVHARDVAGQPPVNNFGAGGASVITLPTDRKYARVLADGTLTAPVLTITLRYPEAALFLVAP